MNTTIVIMCGAIVLYLGASALQWRRLNKGEEPGGRRSPDRSRVHSDGDTPHA